MCTHSPAADTPNKTARIEPDERTGAVTIFVAAHAVLLAVADAEYEFSIGVRPFAALLPAEVQALRQMLAYCIDEGLLRNTEVAVQAPSSPPSRRHYGYLCFMQRGVTFTERGRICLAYNNQIEREGAERERKKHARDIVTG